VEYALLVAFIATVIISSVTALGLTVEGLFVLPCAAWSSCP
jgi:Flp pilus assembly pilin Flp